MPLPLPPVRATGDGDPAADVNLLSAAVAELQPSVLGMGPPVLHTFTEADLTGPDSWYGEGAVVTFVEWTPDRAGRLQIYPAGRGDVTPGLECYLFTAADYPNRTDVSSADYLAYADNYGTLRSLPSQVDVTAIAYVVAVVDWSGTVSATVNLSPLLMSLAALGGVDPLPETPWPLVFSAAGLVPMSLLDLRALVNDGAHAEGFDATASGDNSHAEGVTTTASASSSHAEGISTTASGSPSHAEGHTTTASGDRSHAEGLQAVASATDSHAEGYYTTASGVASHAEGANTTASSNYSHAEGYYTTASSNYSHAEGNETTASGASAHAEGESTTAAGGASHSEGLNTTASASYSHAEGESTSASGPASHAEGAQTIAASWYSHAEGLYAVARTACSHARSGGQFSEAGDSQYVSHELNVQTGDDTPTPADTSFSQGSNEVDVPANRVVGMRAMIAARKADGTLGKAWQVTAAARSDGSAVLTVLGTPVVTVLGEDAGASAWDVAVSTRTGQLRLMCIGAAATTINWSITAETKEVG